MHVRWIVARNRVKNELFGLKEKKHACKMDRGNKSN